MTGSLEEALGRPTVHPFPARMAASVALDAITKLARRAVVLDPMAGSGTALAIGRANGHRCIGFDVDPLAVLISRVWTRAVDPEESRRQAARALRNATSIARDLEGRDAYPFSADSETKAFVRYWFDQHARRQLAALSTAIRAVDGERVRDVLWCALSRTIIAKQAGVSLALDLAHSRPHREFKRAPRRPFDVFLPAVERVIAGCVHARARNRGPEATVALGDARNLALPDASVDLVFTSPPYLNAIDYLRCSKFSLVWMGHSIPSLRTIRRESIGTEVSVPRRPATKDLLEELDLVLPLPRRHLGIFRRYACDTELALAEITRVMAPGATAIFVVGENTVRGSYVPTSQLVSRLARRAGLRYSARKTRHLPSNSRYLPPPGLDRTALDSRMRREVILTFQKGRK
jgi:hypothetical protein